MSVKGVGGSASPRFRTDGAALDESDIQILKTYVSRLILRDGGQG